MVYQSAFDVSPIHRRAHANIDIRNYSTHSLLRTSSIELQKHNSTSIACRCNLKQTLALQLLIIPLVIDCKRATSSRLYSLI